MGFLSFGNLRRRSSSLSALFTRVWPRGLKSDPSICPGSFPYQTLKIEFTRCRALWFTLQNVGLLDPKTTHTFRTLSITEAPRTEWPSKVLLFG